MTGKSGAPAQGRSEGQAEKWEAIVAKIKDEFVQSTGHLQALATDLSGRLSSKGVNMGVAIAHIVQPDCESMRQEIANLLARAAGIFTITVVNGRTIEAAITAGKYGDVRMDVNSERFPMRLRPEGTRTIEFIKGTEFDHNPTSEEIIALAESRGLERPMYEDALDFGEQFPKQQERTVHVWLHEPVSVMKLLFVVVLSVCASGRRLSLSFFNNEWHRSCRFAFIRKPA